MRPVRQVVARVSLSKTSEPQPPSRTLVLDESLEAPRSPPPLPRLGAADRIRDALRRWLEEDM